MDVIVVAKRVVVKAGTKAVSLVGMKVDEWVGNLVVWLQSPLE